MATPPLTVNWMLPVRHRRYERMPASVWVRGLQLLPYLERSGLRCLVNDRRDRADVTVFVRMQDAGALARARRARAEGSRVVFDLCVNYFDACGFLRPNVGVVDRHVAECLAMAEVADAITTSSANIAERAREFHPRVAYLPDSVDLAHFRHVKAWARPSDRPPTAIWAGAGVKAPDLAPIVPLLQARGMRLVVICETRPELAGAVEWVPWRYASLPEALLAGDICVAPRDLATTYNRGHSFFKIGLFMAVGVPAIASLVPSYREILHPGRNGLFADTPGEWAAALDAVCADPARLREWSARARASLVPHTTGAIAEAYADLFGKLCQ